jgi:oxygen-independent coproporphyrinogen-3 oxidase
MGLWATGKVREILAQDVLVETIYFGGGTPSLLRSDLIAKIIDACHAKFRVIASPEITIEINPASSHRRALKELRAAGVNRVSLGIQSLNDEDLRRMGEGP